MLTVSGYCSLSEAVETRYYERNLLFIMVYHAQFIPIFFSVFFSCGVFDRSVVFIWVRKKLPNGSNERNCNILHLGKLLKLICFSLCSLVWRGNSLNSSEAVACVNRWEKWHAVPLIATRSNQDFLYLELTWIFFSKIYCISSSAWY